MENILALIVVFGGGLMLFSKKAQAALTAFGSNSPRANISGYNVDILARTIWGEARGEGREGMQAVANVIMNRFAQAPRFGATVADVCLKPYQFSVWNAGDPNRAKALAANSDTPMFDIAEEIATKALQGSLPDITNGADHYHTASISPYWSEGKTPTAAIGDHLFFNV